MTKPVGPYSPYRKAGNTIYTSGQIGAIDAVVVDGGLEAEFKQALTNLDGVLNNAGVSKHNVIKVNLFLTDMADYNKVNELYLEYFDGEKPARSAVAVASLPLGALIEIEAIAEAGNAA